jgi:hypothetical protein
MSRFLIRPCVQCRNLATKVLSMTMAALADDFERRYNYRPWLVESFVDISRYSGACYKAGNWTRVGRSCGRGRQDRYHESAAKEKEIYLYALDREFRRHMGLSPDAGLGPLEPADGLETGQWAENEFGGAPLGDVRLSRRLVKVAEAKGELPDRAFSGVAKGDWAAVKGYYRMIDHPDESAMSMANILAPHGDRTLRRMQAQRTVLCVQDGSDLNYHNLDQCQGLGEIGKNQTGARSRGLHLHSTFALASNGLPLGIVGARCTAPESRPEEDTRRASAIPIEEKKNFIWIEHHRDLVEVAGQMPQTRLIDVCDREADFFELFDEQRKNPRVELLVRANYNRNITEEPFKLFAAVRNAPVQSEVIVHIPRQSARPKRSKQKARPKRPARTVLLIATMEPFGDRLNGATLKVIKGLGLPSIMLHLRNSNFSSRRCTAHGKQEVRDVSVSSRYQPYAFGGVRPRHCQGRCDGAQETGRPAQACSRAWLACPRKRLAGG